MKVHEVTLRLSYVCALTPTESELTNAKYAAVGAMCGLIPHEDRFCDVVCNATLTYAPYGTMPDSQE